MVDIDCSLSKHKSTFKSRLQNCSMLTIRDKRQESALFYHRNNIAKAMKTLAKKNIQSVSMLMLQKLFENVQTIRNIKWKINTDKIIVSSCMIVKKRLLSTTAS